MSQKTQKIIEKKEKMIQTKQLDNVFNPSTFGVYYPESSTMEDANDERKKQAENDIYKEAVEGLKADMEKLGMDATYSSKIIIREIAMNLVMLGRIKLEFICKGLLRDKKRLKPDSISFKRDSAYPSKSSKFLSYDFVHIHGDEEIHPLFDKLIPKLQKQINDGLKALGLLPSQLIERQKLVIVKKLRQKYENLCGEVSIEARKQINN